MNPTLPIWVEYLRALALPAIAMVGVIVAIGQYRLAEQKRKDELFDRRYALLIDTLDYQNREWDDDYKEVPDSKIAEEVSELRARALLLFDSDFAKGFKEFSSSGSMPDRKGWTDKRLLNLFVRHMK